ncbi:lysine-2,3-aminomutase-like protein [Lichenihabitans sp. Uapishka_5]|uniref:lysine-2,3-aminomutase-like protein n=1 Tax=Lichenihabitans sp. Uapishka_5 TaxID=3037302 RepID=UPI0029E8049B|nr:lysine-2,3-aminomutase-like protein [Lichenihabitans sp. Uapishka_5]MDX7951610.1 lysine-2,3-aminomutase-like protein [Lichenihabitans sp. Uapishka_5]
MTLRSPAALLEAGLIEAAALPALTRVAERYAVAITPAVAALMEPNDAGDPLARQFVPTTAELHTRPEERLDPIGDEVHSPVPGIVHRYPDRVLLKLLHVCPVYCRFCFRREVVGPDGEGTLDAEAVDRALAYVAAHAEIWEVILTGGDPLVLSPRRLGAVLERLGTMAHVKVVRLHSRVPAVAPERIGPALVAALKRFPGAVFVALHANHPREFTPDARAACGRLVDAGIPMLSQSVLLRGVNDDPATLEALMRAFVETRIKPYYLHHGDLAPGTAQFRTTVTDGRALVGELRGRVSGLCQPTYVLDIPGGHGKAVLAASTAEPDGQGGWSVCDRHGRMHAYADVVDEDAAPETGWPA